MFWLLSFASSLACLVFAVSADEAFTHSLLSNVSAFADLGLFQFYLQEFKHGESWRIEKTKISRQEGILRQS